MIIGILGFAGVMFVIWIFVFGLVRGLANIERRSPEEQLQSRFAKGEISEGEYLRSLAILQHGTEFVIDSPREPRPPDP